VLVLVFEPDGTCETTHDVNASTTNMKATNKRILFFTFFIANSYKSEDRTAPGHEGGAIRVQISRQYRTILMVQLHRQKFRQTNQIEAGNS
jgi:hypothetical protein